MPLKLVPKKFLCNVFFFAAAGKKTLYFQLDKEFQVEWGRRTKGIFYKTCSLAKPNLLECKYNDPVKEWDFEESYTFSETGMLHTINFLTKDVTTIRRFDKKTEQQLKQEEE